MDKGSELSRDTHLEARLLSHDSNSRVERFLPRLAWITREGCGGVLGPTEWMYEDNLVVSCFDHHESAVIVEPRFISAHRLNLDEQCDKCLRQAVDDPCAAISSTGFPSNREVLVFHLPGEIHREKRRVPNQVPQRTLPGHFSFGSRIAQFKLTIRT